MIFAGLFFLFLFCGGGVGMVFMGSKVVEKEISSIRNLIVPKSKGFLCNTETITILCINHSF